MNKLEVDFKTLEAEVEAAHLILSAANVGGHYPNGNRLPLPERLASIDFSIVKKRNDDLMY